MRWALFLKFNISQLDKLKCKRWRHLRAKVWADSTPLGPTVWPLLASAKTFPLNHPRASFKPERKKERERRWKFDRIVGVKFLPSHATVYSFLANPLLHISQLNPFCSFHYSSSSSACSVGERKSLRSRENYLLWANSGLFFVYFWSFQKINTLFATDQCEKMSCPSTIWCQDSIPRHLEP